MAHHLRSEKYNVRMSRATFTLLVGWLISGTAGTSTSSVSKLSNDEGKRGRTNIMRIVNDRLRFDGRFESTSKSSFANILIAFEWDHRMHQSVILHFLRVHP